MIKQRRKPFSFLCGTVSEHVTVNETGAFGINPEKGNWGQHFVYNLPFYKQPVYKQAILVC